jgi:glycosyltransferase involved in cell wall biosynthesis
MRSGTNAETKAADERVHIRCVGSFGGENVGRNYSATVVYGDTLSVENWQIRHAAGTVPSHWPYGLDLLREHGVALSVAGAGESRLGDAVVGPAVTFGFDERVASTVAAAVTNRACGVIWLAEPSVSVRQFVKKKLAIRDLRKLDLIWCYSPALVEELARILRVDDSKVRFVPLGIDEEFYAPEPYPQEGVVLSVGNDRSRDSKSLYEAMEIIYEARPQTRFLVQSKDPYPAPKFVDRVDQFADHAELRRNYAEASLVMIATRPNMYTSGSTVALEVQAMARPVVITDTPGMGAYVEHGTSGYRALPGDPEDLAGYGLRILNNRSIGTEMGLAGHARVIKQNTTRIMAEKIDFLMSGLVSS